ncbi:MAG: hypothetical protein GYB31_04600 [Bacteroidetes bacterium]|nr:hypothetical protein [Bacteroidota bacterium]
MDQKLFWEEVIRTALIGTDRHRLDANIREWLVDRGIDLPKEGAQELLAASSVFSVLQRSTALPPKYEGKLPEKLEQKPGGPSGLTRISRRLLREPYRKALPEFVRLCRENNLQLPPESVPALLDQALSDGSLRKHLPALTGKLGAWLCTQNPKWGPLQWEASIEDWIDHNPEVQYGLLLKLREESPSSARLFLEGIWEKLHHHYKLRFLGIFRNFSEPADESLLLKAIEDSRLEVRKKAAVLLLELDGSQISEVAWDEIRRLVQVSSKSLKIDFPESPSNFLQEYRLQDSSEVKGLSLRESWLYFLVVRMSLARWKKEASPARLLEAASDHREGESLLRAWWKAGLRNPDPDWNKAWLNWLLDRQQLPDWMYKKDLKELVQAGKAGRLSGEELNKTLKRVLRKQDGLIRENSALHLLLMYAPQVWSKEVSWLFLSRFQEYVQESEAYFWDSWHYKDLLREASFHLWPGLTEELTEQWASGEIHWGVWEQEVAWMLDVLHFRKEFWEELAG